MALEHFKNNYTFSSNVQNIIIHADSMSILDKTSHCNIDIDTFDCCIFTTALASSGILSKFQHILSYSGIIGRQAKFVLFLQ